MDVANHFELHGKMRHARRGVNNFKKSLNPPPGLRNQ
jgi:hypothetical protein